jgi:hypothetical protein
MYLSDEKTQNIVKANSRNLFKFDLPTLG